MDEYELNKLLTKINELETELKTAKKYGLVWDRETTEEIIAKECSTKIPVLTNIKDNNIENGEINNILIEGDNLHSLITLQSVFENRVDFIYIDPPYNTGHEDFAYNDKFVNEDDGYKHSKWLSFMSKRLKLAKNLLSDDGVMFISIDDNEQANLRLLCNSIFGENCVEQYIWCLQDKTEGSFVKTAGLTVRKEHEYIIACFKNSGKRFKRYKGEREFSDGSFSNPDNDPRGPWFSGNISRNGIKSTTGSKYYSITNPAGEVFTRNWTLSKEEYETALAEGRIYFSKGGAGVPRLKIYANQDTFLIQSSLFNDVHTSITGKNELKNIFGGESPFNFPKPPSLIKRLLEIASNENSIILDFFAGSGTTGQAVLELNKEDFGKRQFILCTNNENEICTKITYPRIKTVITGKRVDGSPYGDNMKTNLYYYKTSFVNDLKNTDQAKYNLAEKLDELLCILEDIYKPVSKNSYSSHYSNLDNSKHLFIYNDFYNKNNFEEFVNLINSTQGEKTVYIYGNNDDCLYESYEINNAIIKAIPAKIYETYKEIVAFLKRGE